MTFAQHIVDKIPLTVAADFFIGLKTASIEPPDETGALEGQFTVPIPEALQLLSAMVENEMKTMLAYKTYANSLRGLAHHSIAEEFEDHAENELDHADFLLRRMSVLGGPIHLSDVPAPPASSDPVQIVKIMIRLEQEGIAKWKALHSILGDNPTKFKVEEYMTVEQEHLDELWQVLPHEAQDMGVPMAPTGQVQDQAGMAPEGAGKQAGVKDWASKVKDFAKGVATGEVHRGGIPLSKIPAPPISRGEEMTRAYEASRRFRGNGKGGFEISKTSAADLENMTPKMAEASFSPGRYSIGADDQIVEALMPEPRASMRALRNTVAQDPLALGGALSGAMVGGHVGNQLGGPLGSWNSKLVTIPVGALLGAMGGGLAGGAVQHAVTHQHPEHQKAASAFKLALEQLPGAAAPVAAMVAQEQAAQEAEEAASAAYFQERFQEATAQLQQAQQAQQGMQQQLEGLTQQQAAAQEQIQSAQQQGQQMSQMATQTAQAANQQASQAMMQAMMAQKDLIAQQGQATQMRIAYENFRQALSQLASTEPPPAMAPASSLLGGALPPSGPEQAAMAGTPEQAPGAQGSPTAVGPDANPAASQGPTGPGAQTAQGTSVQGTMDPSVSVPAQPGEKVSHLDPEKLTGMALGGLVGAAATQLMPNKSFAESGRARLQELESRKDDSFFSAFRMAKAKAQLALAEGMDAHPGVAALGGGLLGARIGGAALPAAMTLARNAQPTIA